MISEKIHNYEFAPGIATYGVNGKTGAKGDDGNTLFYTSYDLLDTTDLRKFISALKANKLPVYNNDQVIERVYIDGDMFFDSVGNIYTLKDKSYIYGEGVASNATSYRKFMRRTGLIKLSDKDSVITTGSNNRVTLDSAYNGLDINTQGESDYALRVSSTQADGNQYIMKLQTTYGDNVSSSLNFYYDSNLGAYHIQSDSPILLDADVKVSDKQSENIDGYSSIVTTNDNDTITNYYNMCKKCQVHFQCEKDSLGNTYKYHIENDEYNKLDSITSDYEEAITVKVMYREYDTTKKTLNSEVKLWMCQYKNGDDNFISVFNDDFSSKNISIKSISFIYNIECFVKTYID